MMCPGIKMLLKLKKPKNQIRIKKKERNLMRGVMNLNTLKVSTQVSLSNIFQIFIFTIVMNTNNAGNRRRSHNNESKERRKIICYRCNNIGHIARNCRTPDDQCNGGNRRNVPTCQLCNNFGHTAKSCRMDRRIFNRNQNSRRNRRRSVDSLREDMKEQIEDFKKKFVKAREPGSSHIVLEGTHHDAPNKTIKSLVVSDFSFQN